MTQSDRIQIHKIKQLTLHNMLIQREQCSDTSGSLFNTTVDCDVQYESVKGKPIYDTYVFQ